MVAVVTLVACGGKRPTKPKEASDPPNVSCESSHVCKTFGWCAEEGGQCVAKSEEQCRSSEACKRGGLCTLDRGRCIARSSSDCDRSEWCDKYGLCSEDEGVCK